MPWVRTRILGNDDVIVEKKRWWLPAWFGNMAFEPVTTLSAARNEVECQIDEAIRKLEDLLEKRSRLSEDLAAEVREVSTYKHNRFGVSEPFWIDPKPYKDWAKPNKKRPDISSWRSFFNPLICRQYGLSNDALKNGNSNNTSNNSRPAKGQPSFNSGEVIHSPEGLTTYTLQGKGGMLAPSVDNKVMEFKDPNNQPKSDKNARKEQMRQLRQDNPKESWESDKEWNDRINELARDKFGSH